MKHQKHAFVQKPAGGKFHRNEIAFLGAPCGVIQRLADQVRSSLSDVQTAFVDADHNESEEKLKFGATYTDKISHHQFEFDHRDYTYRYRQLFNDQEAVLVNGNHFLAEQQIVIVNHKKEDSLKRKLDRLTKVSAIVLDDGISEPFDFLREHLQGVEEIPIISISDVAQIAQIVKSSFSLGPSVKGLVLTGGKSSRMGHDKGNIDYHGKPQKEHVADLLNDLCDEVFLSVQKSEDLNSTYSQISDSFLNLGPYGGILSAFRQDPNSAWLTVATDIPLLDSHTLSRLIAERDPSKMATCFHNEETGFPEPLITLWEPRAYPIMLQFLTFGYSCPRKVLINNEVKELQIDQHLLTNANTPEEHTAALKMING